jgi:hypothetical protein
MQPSVRRSAPRALAVALPAIALFAFGVRYHEPWRDEVQALLIGRDVPLSGLVHAMRLEGHPPLYHLLLKLFCVALPAPVALAAAAALGFAALLAGTYHLLVVLSRRPRVALALTLALACTNTYAYELGVVSRPYGLGLGLVLGALGELLVALRLRRSSRRATLLAGLAALTSAHAACVAGAALAAYAITASIRRRSLRPALPTLLALPFFAATLVCIAPYAQRTPASASAENPRLVGAWGLALMHLEKGTFAGGWWRDGGVQWPPDWPVFPVFALALALIAAVHLARRRRDRAASGFLLGFVALSWATLLYIFVAWYSGAYRHHLHLWIPALVIALGWLAGTRAPPRWALAPLGAAALLLAPWMVYQLHMAWDDLAGDARGAFTQTKSAAALLPEGARVVGDDDCAILGLRLWRADLTLRSTRSLGRRFRTLVYDRDWHTRAPLGPLVAEECREAPDRTFLARHDQPTAAIPPACLSLVQAHHGLQLTERFDLYRVDCACLGR